MNLNLSDAPVFQPEVQEKSRSPLLCSWPRCCMFVVLGNSSSFPSQDEPSGLFLSHQLLKTSAGYLSLTIWAPYLGLKGCSNNDNLLSAINLRAQGAVFHALSCSSIWSRVSIFSPQPLHLRTHMHKSLSLTPCQPAKRWAWQRGLH